MSTHKLYLYIYIHVLHKKFFNNKILNLLFIGNKRKEFHQLLKKVCIGTVSISLISFQEIITVFCVEKKNLKPFE